MYGLEGAFSQRWFMSDPIVLSAQCLVPWWANTRPKGGCTYQLSQVLRCVFARYGFWSLNRFVLHQLYFLNRRRRHFGRRSASSANDADAFTRAFGSAAPSSLPESTEWWRRQSRELFASVHGPNNMNMAQSTPCVAKAFH